ncbi:MAG: hemerythrin domain-containing protein [Desulfobacca sp.]|uniref:hemerythrin domain-containing protein n=1 Tax=Desulfobacca sp. TaxID=2067990 RepID=UPI00404A4279
MLPIAPLMIEHRLIERLICLMAQEKDRLQANIALSPAFAFVEPRFLRDAVAFLQGYADARHHGKEEAILFAALQGKPLSPEHRRILLQLQAEHRHGREATQKLAAATQRYHQGHEEALTDILAGLEVLVNFYPAHIATEDQEFFLPVMAYFSEQEQAALLDQMQAFDQDGEAAAQEKLVVDWEGPSCKCHL